MSHRHSDSDKIKQITGIAALAAGVGAAVALLLAPKSGADTRSKIRTAAKNQRDSLINRTKTVDVSTDSDEATNQAKTVATEAKTAVTKAQTSVKEKLLDLKKEVKNTKDEINKK